jgi:hypothetical protein
VSFGFEERKWECDAGMLPRLCRVGLELLWVRLRRALWDVNRAGEVFGAPRNEAPVAVRLRSGSGRG